MLLICGTCWTPTATRAWKSLSPTSQNAYARLGSLAKPFVRTGWRALVAADVLQKALLIYRPYEPVRGDTEAVYEVSLDDLCRTLESTPVEPRIQLDALAAAMVRCRGRFHGLGAHRDGSRPLVGIVGEIFCRLNTFSNENLVRQLEEYGAEAWLSDIVEWIWYTESERFRKAEETGRKDVDTRNLGAWVRDRVQKHDEHTLAGPFRADFAGREEPDVYEILECARPYLPREGAFRRDGAECRQGCVPGEEGGGRHHRYQPIYLHERNCLRSHLPASEP